MNMFVPPNTIDFSTVFSKFSTDNLAVLITVGLVLLAYFLLLIPVIRADKRDFKKVIISICYNIQISLFQGGVYISLGSTVVPIINIKSPQ